MTNRFKPKRNYVTPPEVNPAELMVAADRRRAALIAGGCSTYTIGYRGGQPGIVCLCCGLGSSHQQDIAQRYCGFCQQFHSAEEGDPAQ